MGIGPFKTFNHFVPFKTFKGEVSSRLKAWAADGFQTFNRFRSTIRQRQIVGAIVVTIAALAAFLKILSGINRDFLGGVAEH
jgi:hypothetical protein